MIIVNMWFIKHSNGLFHYGLDYTEALGGAVREIWVRSEVLANMVRRRLPDARVLVQTVPRLMLVITQLCRKGDLLFTPSSHPLPLLRRQVLVVHDSFSFTGKLGPIKLAFFKLSLALSGGAAAHINQSDGYRFLKRCSLDDKRILYLPNRVDVAEKSYISGALTLGTPIVVGLFGSDSAKKNYDALFAAFEAEGPQVQFVWRIYGHSNTYVEHLRITYPRLSIEVVESDAVSMIAFIHSIDIAVSVAENEGFARPIAVALTEGVPTFLLDTPVFHEFYTGSAKLFVTPQALVSALAELRPGKDIARPTLVNAAQLRHDFDCAVSWLEKY